MLGLGVAACGQQSHPTVADSEGFYVDAGPITYQVQLSRELNPYNVEDKAYLNGVTAVPPKPDEEWFAIFLWAKNQTKSTQMTTDSFDLVDTQGNTYYPIPLNPTFDPYAWIQQPLAPSATEPAPESPASFGPTQGAEVLFKINISAYANRPLTLEIHAAGQAQPSTVSIDL